MARIQRRIDLIARFAEAEILRAGRKDDSRQEYLAPDGAVGLERVEVEIAGDRRAAFLEHPDQCVVFRSLRIPRRARLDLGLGIRPDAWGHSGDGVRFRVLARKGTGARTLLLDRYIDPKSREADRRWFDESLDLSAFPGRAVELFFETDGGPAGDTDYDWAVWSRPVVLDRDGEAVVDLLDRFDRRLLYREVESERVRLDEVAVGEDLRSVLFLHPTTTVRYRGVDVHRDATARFGVALDPGCWDSAGDGVDFEIWVVDGGDRTRAFHRYVDPKNRPEDRRWFDEEVDLDRWSGRTVILELGTRPGPAGDERFDWAVWSEPVVESRGIEIRIPESDRVSHLLITLDTLRSDHLGCYGGRFRTPHLDRLAAEGLRFRRAWCQSNVTIPSHVSILSGVLPHRHILDNRRHRIPDDVPLLPEAFQAAGFRTFGATSVHILGPSWTLGIDRGFDGFDAVDRSRRAGERTAAVFRHWLEGLRGEPFFAWVHLFDPHAPYRPSRAYDRMYYEGDERDANGPGLPVELPPFLVETRDWLAGVTDPAYPAAQYAAQVTRTDSIVGDLLGTLSNLGLAERTLVCVTADHGESLGEHGVHYNHVGLFEEVTRIPLLLRPPSAWCREGPGGGDAGPLQRGRSIDADVMSVDLAPTILELAGLPVPEGIDGRSLLPWIHGEPGSPHRWVVAEHTDMAQVMVLRDGWKYLRTERDLEYTRSFSLRAGEELLFDLSRSPREAEDLLALGGQRLEAMREAAVTLLGSREEGRPEDDLAMDHAMRTRLRDLGYL